MKKTLKILTIAFTVILIAVGLYFGNAFLGNPVSHSLAENAAERYIAEQYQGTDYVIESVGYNFKTGGYYAKINSPSSKDTYFYLDFSSNGTLERDSYNGWVLSGRNTLDRINLQYNEMLDNVFESPDFPYNSDIAGGEIKGMFDIEVDSLEKDYGLDPTALELDKEYDVMELGAKHGSVTFYAYDEDVSVERACEILLDITNILKDNNISFYAIDFVLQNPKNEDGTPNEDDSYIWLIDFLYSDIYTEDFEELVLKSSQETVEYFARKDAENAK